LAATNGALKKEEEEKERGVVTSFLR